MWILHYLSMTPVDVREINHVFLRYCLGNDSLPCVEHTAIRLCRLTGAQ